MKLILRTPSGSRLYGLSHSKSDEDWIEVYGWNKSRAKHSISDNQDIARTSFDRFMRNAEAGSPQYLEAMFSTMCEVNEIPYITSCYRPNMTQVRLTYRRTMKALWAEGVEADSFKKRRHAFRLWLNLREMEKRGRFNPTLTDDEITMVNKLAVDSEYEYLLDL